MKLNKVIDSEQQSILLTNDEARDKMLDSETIYKKSKYFARFDHSIVVIEFEKLKIATSLEQAISILEKYYDRH